MVRRNQSADDNPFYELLAKADETYAKLPLRLKLEVEKISRGLAEFGPRKSKRRGPGTEFFESRPYDPQRHDRRDIHARLSARVGSDTVVEREAEIRQHFYLWRDPSPSMDYSSDPDTLFTKKQAAEVMVLALAKHLARNEELIGVLDGDGKFRGSRASERVARHFADVSVMTGDMPSMRKNLPRNSTVLMFSDFLMDPDDVLEGLTRLKGKGLEGYLVMVLDPEELEFTFSGHTKFEGFEGEGVQTFQKAQAMRSRYQQEMTAHIQKIRDICKARGFEFILQRTDQPLHNALLDIYGIRNRSSSPETGPSQRQSPGQ